MKYQLADVAYNRAKAVDYAHHWAYRRNPAYYNFDDIGGDCTNFASQCIYAGSGVMNYTPTFGWYYVNVNDRAPAWTGVPYLFQFLTSNQGVGPYGREAEMDEIQPGDVCQLIISREIWQHTPVIVQVGSEPTLDSILVAAHSNDCDCRPLSTYAIRDIRFIHIEGVRYLNSADLPQAQV